MTTLVAEIDIQMPDADRAQAQLLSLEQTVSLLEAEADKARSSMSGFGSALDDLTAKTDQSAVHMRTHAQASHESADGLKELQSRAVEAAAELLGISGIAREGQSVFSSFAAQAHAGAAAERDVAVGAAEAVAGLESIAGPAAVAGAAILGLKESVDVFNDLVGGESRAAAAFNITTTQAEAFGHMLRSVGMDGDNNTQFLLRLTSGLTEAQNSYEKTGEASGRLVEGMKMLGLSVQNEDGTFKTQGQIIDEAIPRFEALHRSGADAAGGINLSVVAADIFGQRTGPLIIKALEGAGLSYQRAKELAAEFGNASEANQAKFYAEQTALTLMHEEIEHVAVVIGSAAIPALVGMADGMATDIEVTEKLASALAGLHVVGNFKMGDLLGAEISGISDSLPIIGPLKEFSEIYKGLGDLYGHVTGKAKEHKSAEDDLSSSTGHLSSEMGALETHLSGVAIAHQTAAEAARAQAQTNADVAQIGHESRMADIAGQEEIASRERQIADAHGTMTAQQVTDLRNLGQEAQAIHDKIVSLSLDEVQQRKQGNTATAAAEAAMIAALQAGNLQLAGSIAASLDQVKAADKERIDSAKQVTDATHQAVMDQINDKLILASAEQQIAAAGGVLTEQQITRIRNQAQERQAAFDKERAAQDAALTAYGDYVSTVESLSKQLNDDFRQSEALLGDVSGKAIVDWQAQLSAAESSLPQQLTLMAETMREIEQLKAQETGVMSDEDRKQLGQQESLLQTRLRSEKDAYDESYRQASEARKKIDDLQKQELGTDLDLQSALENFGLTGSDPLLQRTIQATAMITEQRFAQQEADKQTYQQLDQLQRQTAADATQDWQGFQGSYLDVLNDVLNQTSSGTDMMAGNFESSATRAENAWTTALGNIGQGIDQVSARVPAASSVGSGGGGIANLAVGAPAGPMTPILNRGQAVGQSPRYSIDQLVQLGLNEGLSLNDARHLAAIMLREGLGNPDTQEDYAGAGHFGILQESGEIRSRFGVTNPNNAQQEVHAAAQLILSPRGFGDWEGYNEGSTYIPAASGPSGVYINGVPATSLFPELATSVGRIGQPGSIPPPAIASTAPSIGVSNRPGENISMLPGADWGRRMAEGISDSQDDVDSAAEAVIDSVNDVVTDKTPDIHDAGKEYGFQFAEGYQGTSEDTKNAAQGQLTALIDTLGGQLPTIAQWGEAYPEQFSTSFNHNAPLFQQAARNALQAMNNDIKLGITDTQTIVQDGATAFTATFATAVIQGMNTATQKTLTSTSEIHDALQGQKSSLELVQEAAGVGIPSAFEKLGTSSTTALQQIETQSQQSGQTLSAQAVDLSNQLIGLTQQRAVSTDEIEKASLDNKIKLIKQQLGYVQGEAKDEITTAQQAASALNTVWQSELSNWQKTNSLRSEIAKLTDDDVLDGKRTVTQTTVGQDKQQAESARATVLDKLQQEQKWVDKYNADLAAGNTSQLQWDQQQIQTFEAWAQAAGQNFDDAKSRYQQDLAAMQQMQQQFLASWTAGMDLSSSIAQVSQESIFQQHRNVTQQTIAMDQQQFNSAKSNYLSLMQQESAANAQYMRDLQSGNQAALQADQMRLASIKAVSDQAGKAYEQIKQQGTSDVQQLQSQGPYDKQILALQTQVDQANLLKLEAQDTNSVYDEQLSKLQQQSSVLADMLSLSEDKLAAEGQTDATNLELLNLTAQRDRLTQVKAELDQVNDGYQRQLTLSQRQSTVLQDQLNLSQALLATQGKTDATNRQLLELQVQRDKAALLGGDTKGLDALIAGQQGQDKLAADQLALQNSFATKNLASMAVDQQRIKLAADQNLASNAQLQTTEDQLTVLNRQITALQSKDRIAADDLAISNHDLVIQQAKLTVQRDQVKVQADQTALSNQQLVAANSVAAALERQLAILQAQDKIYKDMVAAQQQGGGQGFGGAGFGQPFAVPGGPIPVQIAGFVPGMEPMPVNAGLTPQTLSYASGQGMYNQQLLFGH